MPPTKEKQPNENDRRPEFVQPMHPPLWWDGEQPAPSEPAPDSALSPDEIETGEVPGELGDPTIPKPRQPTGLTPTAGLPRPVPPPQRPGYIPPASPPPAGGAKPAASPPPHPWGQIILKIAFANVAGLVLLFFLGVIVSIVGYFVIALQLPAPTELQARQTQFVSSKIFDREGNLLYEVTDPEGGRRTYVPYDRISQHLIDATVATEDRNFWLHPGFDPFAIARAIYYALSEREIVSGFSTITQQVARNVLLTPEERMQRTAWRKIKEVVLAAELTRVYPKETILEIYLNENYYGNLTYGIQAASETYFGVDAEDLTLAQASFLAGLPQLPAIYDPLSNGLEQALQRQEIVLGLMAEDGYISHTDAALAAAETQDYEFHPLQLDLATAPHFVVYARQIVEGMFGPEALYRGTGLRIHTTLDPRLQGLAEQQVRAGVAALADRDATNGALVALDPTTGHILALVGSADFQSEEIDGQVNVALRCRQPGSSIKPLTYIAAFERGWTPATLLWDVRTEFPDGANPPYVPVNYDRQYHGPMLVREALANSYNVPAVEALQFVGVDNLLEMAGRLGVASLVHPETECPDYPYDQPPAYGLALTLGGGEAKLLEMTAAFAAFANGGMHVSPSPILRIEDSQGNVLIDNATPAAERAISSEHAYLITSILSDAEARSIEFGRGNSLELSRPAAAKTGTTDDYRDALTIGYTPQLVTGVWVGNSDNSPMNNVPGAGGAGPIWHDFMEAAHADWPVLEFARPAGIVEHEICADSGARPTEHCPRRARELFAQSQPPLDETHDWYQMVRIDPFTHLLANEFCPEQNIEQVMLVITDPRGREWVQAHPEQFGGLALAPLDACTASTDHPQVLITYPDPGSTIYGVVSIRGTVQLPNFERYEVQYGVGGNPQGWGWISGPHLSPVYDGPLTEWDTSHLASGLYTLRVTAFGQGGHGRVEGRVQVFVGVPTETPTPFPSATPLTTPTATPTFPPSPTATPEPSPTSNPTPLPSKTVPPPIPIPTVTPTAGITVTLAPTATMIFERDLTPSP